MPRYNRILSVLMLLLISALTSVVVGKGEKPDRPKEANVESISADIDPSLRTAIADKLRDEMDAAKEQLSAKRASLEELQKKLREEEQQVRELDLKVQYLKDRLDQWSPKGATDEVKPDETSNEKVEPANPQSDTEDPSEETDP